MATQAIGIDPVTTLAIVGALGVGSQLLAWRLNIPAIVLMLVSGVVAGPVLGLINPMRDLGEITSAMISIAVAVILFEGGLTLNFKTLSDASKGVTRLVVIGAPLGWLTSTLALYYGAGLGWPSAIVFGGIMIVTGPTVIAPLLRQARLPHRPAALLQWEAIVNDPIGALAAVLAFEVVLVINLSTTVEQAASIFAAGIFVSTLAGLAAGYGLAAGFRRGWVPEYMKVPVLFVVLIAIFALSNIVLHESGLLAVTVMGIVLANANLPSYGELLRFKEHATVLLVSGVFILLASSLDFASLGALNWQAGLFVALVVLVARPVTVMISLIKTDIPMRERLLVALTGPRGVVLVAVAGLFGERLSEIGYADGALIAPLAFVLVSVTVVLHGFTLVPLARFLGLSRKTGSSVIVVGATSWGMGFAKALNDMGVQVVLADKNYRNLRAARTEGIPHFYGDILSEAAEHHMDLHNYDLLFAVSESDDYNTLVTTDFAPEFGRSAVFQIAREREGATRYALPATLGGRGFGNGMTYLEGLEKSRQGWRFKVTNVSEDFDIAAWRAANPEGIVIAWSSDARLHIAEANGKFPAVPNGAKLLAFVPPDKNSEKKPI